MGFDTGNSTSTTFDYANNILDPAAGSLGLVVFGNGTLVLSGVNTYTGGTQLLGGTCEFATPAALPAGVSVAGDATLAVNVAGGWQSSDIDALLASGDFAAGANLGFDTGDSTSTTFTYASNIADTTAGSLGLVIFGSGALLLGGDNSYTGGTSILGGTVQIASASNLGSGPVTLDGGTVQATSDITLAVPVTLGAGGGIIDSDGNTVTLIGTISGSGGLTLIDSSGSSGTVLLSGDASGFTGAINVEAGTVRVANQNAARGIWLELCSSSTAATSTSTGLQRDRRLAQWKRRAGILNSGSTSTLTVAFGNDTSTYVYAGEIEGYTPLNFSISGDGIQDLTGYLPLVLSEISVGAGSTLNIDGGLFYNYGTLENEGTINVINGAQFRTARALVNDGVLNVSAGSSLWNYGMLQNYAGAFLSIRGYAYSFVSFHLSIMPTST